MHYEIKDGWIVHDFGRFPKPAEYMPRKELDAYVERMCREAMRAWQAGEM